MSRKNYARLLCSAAVIALASGTVAWADEASFNIAPQSLDTALNAFSEQSAHPVLFKSDMALAKRTQGVTGSSDPELALNQLLQGTGLTWKRAGDTFVITEAADPQSGSAAGDGADSGTVQALIVTAQKREENIQDVPIAMSAFSQEDLTRSQVATGADLMTQVPNMTFTKTNFTGYSIQIRGIGTQAISVTTDPAVAVAFNNTPFIRNRFFEQEFYDLQRVEVLRGPQGTLYGRNATAGVVNLISQKPKFTYEAKASIDVSNYNSHRLEGMINLPLVDDKVAMRLAGAWTKRDGFTTNETTGRPTDGRDLWSTRLSLRIEPTDAIRANLIWEHFQEDDDRLRSGKQLCHRDARTEFAGHPILFGQGYYLAFNQNCLPASLYSPDSFEAPNGMALQYRFPTFGDLDVYKSTTQPRDLRVIQTEIEPKYRAKSDIAEFQFSANLNDHLTLTSETGYNADRISSFEDFNRFAPNHATFDPSQVTRRPSVLHMGPDGTPEFCDPQLGCADHLMAGDLSNANSRQFSEELRLASNFESSFNFSLGANFLRYDTMEKYYVFINTLTLRAAVDYPQGTSGPPPWPYGAGDNRECLSHGLQPPDFNKVNQYGYCQYIDPNPIDSLNDLGHNYFLSQNPYKLISYAVFGEAYYNITEALKLTAGLRWTVDKKNSPRIPSWVLADQSAGYPVVGVERQQWREPTGRLALDWKPKLSFTEETLLYASFAHGYKAGGSNPPPTGLVTFGSTGAGLGEGLLANWATHPLTFKPEFVNAYEVGSKNTLFGGSLTLNGNVFFYDYTGYQISQIIDRSALNFNFDAKVWGAELELDWRPLENLRLGLKGGYEKTRVASGQKAVDVMERNYGHGPDSADPWIVVKPFPTFPSNCVLPLSTVVRRSGVIDTNPVEMVNGIVGPCEVAYAQGLDPVTMLPFVANPTEALWGSLHSYYPDDYPGYDPNHDVGQNHGAGFFKDLSGHELPNAPHFTTSVTADYTMPLPNNWLATVHTDLYYQSEAWTRIFNTPGYDKLKAFTNVNVAAIFSNEDAGWKVMAYVKNVFDKDNITGAFLNSDDTGLTTNVFLVEPRLYGLRLTKDWNGGPWWTGANPNHTGPYPLTIEVGGTVQRQDAPYGSISPSFASDVPAAIDPRASQHRKLDWGDERQVSVTYRPAAGSWSIAAALRYGRANTETTKLHQEFKGPQFCFAGPPLDFWCSADYQGGRMLKYPTNFSDSSARTQVEHTVADFSVGKDVGMGLGLRKSSASLGLRYADFSSETHIWMDGVPDWDVPAQWALFKYAHHSNFDATLTSDRRFEGAGPTLSWAASHSLLGSDTTGHLDVDWSLSGGALFGKQKASIRGEEKSGVTSGKYYQLSRYIPLVDWTTTPVNIQRSKSVTVPVVDLSLGLSYDIQRVKLSTGYRWERYYNALDGGYAERKSFDRTNSGPYFKIAVGFGG